MSLSTLSLKTTLRRSTEAPASVAPSLPCPTSRPDFPPDLRPVAVCGTVQGVGAEGEALTPPGLLCPSSLQDPRQAAAGGPAPPVQRRLHEILGQQDHECDGLRGCQRRVLLLGMARLCHPGAPRRTSCHPCSAQRAGPLCACLGSFAQASCPDPSPDLDLQKQGPLPKGSLWPGRAAGLSPLTPAPGSREFVAHCTGTGRVRGCPPAPGPLELVTELGLPWDPH